MGRLSQAVKGTKFGGKRIGQPDRIHSCAIRDQRPSKMHTSRPIH
jgi:hypothetical protein